MKTMVISFLTVLFFLAGCQCGSDDDSDDDDNDGLDDDDGAGDDDSQDGDDTAGDDSGDDDAQPPEFNIVTGSCELLWWEPGREFGSAMGLKVAGLQDFDGDGFPDVLMTVNWGNTTTLKVRSGPAGSGLRSVWIDMLVYSIAATGDMDGDGAPDAAVGGAKFPLDDDVDDDSGVVSDDDAGEYGVMMISLASGEVIWEKDAMYNEIEFGSAVAAAADYNGDGKADLLVASPFPSPTELTPGFLHILSGADGENLYTLSAPADSSESFPFSLAQASDIDGGGTPDVFAGDPRGPASYYGAGIVSAISVESGLALWQAQGGVSGEVPDLFADQIASGIDLNGDGTQDLLASAHNHPVEEACAWAPEGVGQIRAFDGATGSELWSADGRRCNEGLGIGLVAAGDVDGDGAADIAVGAPSPMFPLIVLGQGGRFMILSGADHSVIFDVESVVGPDDRSDEFGISVAGIGDVTGDGRAEVVVGAPGFIWGDIQNAGLVTVWTCPE